MRLVRTAAVGAAAIVTFKNAVTVESSNIPHIKSSSSSSSSQQHTCRLWLAPSHTGGTGKEQNPVKFGLFAGIDYAENETLPLSEIAIPLPDLVESYNRDTQFKDSILNLLEGYLWMGQFAGAAMWEGNYSSPMAVPGIGILANYHSGIYNVKWLEGETLLQSTNSQKDQLPFRPGVAHVARGAMTPYGNMTFQATQRIPAGMEIFANFGDVWDGNYTDDYYQDKLTRWDYMAADKIVQHMVQFMNQHNQSLSDQQRDRIVDFMLDTILATAGGKHAKVIKSLIPAHADKLQKVLDAGGTFMYRNVDLIKSQRWLQKHGVCLDTLTVGPSTIPDAGRGAFATRSFQAGETITLSPMLHIPSQDLMHMYHIHSQPVPMSDGEFSHRMYDRTRYLGQQLLINYCFSHRESNLLLFPIGSLVTMMNHQPHPNAYITWSNHAYMPNDHNWHTIAPNELLLDADPATGNADGSSSSSSSSTSSNNRLGVVMKVVASKDIQKGDEVFLDYGPDWAWAWHAHVTQFQKVHHDGDIDNNNNAWPLKAMDMNDLYHDPQTRRPFETNVTLQQQQSSSSSSSYPPGVTTACFLETTDPDDGFPKRNVNGISIVHFVGPTNVNEYTGSHMYLCQIQNGMATHDAFYYNYTVWVLGSSSSSSSSSSSYNNMHDGGEVAGGDTDSDDKKDDWVVTTEVRHVPHAAITFVDRPYQSDIHTPGAFRHWIGILDTHFPQAWRDKR